MLRTSAQQRVELPSSLHGFYLYVHWSLTAMADYLGTGLDTRTVQDSTILLRYGPNRLPIAVGSPSELCAQLPEHVRKLRITVIVTAVSLVESFLEEVFCELFTSCPEILVDSQRARAEVTKEEAAHETGIEKLAKEKAKRTASKPFERILEFLEKKGLIDSNATPFDLSVVNEIFATRNILVHNNGRVDDRYLRLCPACGLQEGQQRPISPEYVVDSLAYLDGFCIWVDGQVAQAIAGRSGKQLPSWPDWQFSHRRLTRIITRWCVARRDAEGSFSHLHPIVLGINHSFELPSGDVCFVCEFDEPDLERLEAVGNVVVFPESSTAACNFPARAQEWMQGIGITISGADSVGTVVEKLRALSKTHDLPR